MAKFGLSMMTKEQRQVASLASVLVTIVGVVLYVYRGDILPSPAGTVDGVTPSRVTVPSNDDKDPFFEREDYRALRSTPGVPVLPIPVNSQGVDPFVTEKE